MFDPRVTWQQLSAQEREVGVVAEGEMEFLRDQIKLYFHRGRSTRTGRKVSVLGKRGRDQAALEQEANEILNETDLLKLDLKPNDELARQLMLLQKSLCMKTWRNHR